MPMPFRSSSSSRPQYLVLDRLLSVFGTVVNGKGCDSQVWPRAIGGNNTCHKMRHNLSLTTVTYICMREHPHFHHGPTSSFLHYQPIQTPPSGLGSPVPLVKSSFGIIPLSRHSVDRSPRAFHSSTHNVVRASSFEVLNASVESRKLLFLDGILCFATRFGATVQHFGLLLKLRISFKQEGVQPPAHMAADKDAHTQCTYNTYTQE